MTRNLRLVGREILVPTQPQTDEEWMAFGHRLARHEIGRLIVVGIFKDHSHRDQILAGYDTYGRKS